MADFIAQFGGIGLAFLGAALAVGRSYHEAPDIDGNIFIENAAELEVGQMVRVRILQGFTYEMVAELV